MNDEQVSDLELLEYLSSHLPAERQAQIDALLAGDESLRRRLSELRRTWELMGDWRVDAAGTDLRAGVQERLARRRGLSLPNWPAVNWRIVGRVAATWLIAIGLGITIARTVPWRQPMPQEPSLSLLEDEISQRLYLDMLGSGGSTGMTQSLLEDDSEEDHQ